MSKQRLLACLSGNALSLLVLAGCAPKTPTAEKILDANPRPALRPERSSRARLDFFTGQFSHPLSAAVLRDRAASYSREAKLGATTCNAWEVSVENSGRYRIHALTVAFSDTPMSALVQFAAKIQRDAPDLAIQEMTLAPDRTNLTLMTGTITLYALEVVPRLNETPPPTTHAEEDLLAQCQKFARQPLHPFEMLATMNSLRPGSIYYTALRFYDENFVTAECVADDRAVITQMVDALDQSNFVTVDQRQLEIRTAPDAGPANYRFTLSLAFSTRRNLPFAPPPAAAGDGWNPTPMEKAVLDANPFIPQGAEPGLPTEIPGAFSR